MILNIEASLIMHFPMICFSLKDGVAPAKVILYFCQLESKHGIKHFKNKKIVVMAFAISKCNRKRRH